MKNVQGGSHFICSKCRFLCDSEVALDDAPRILLRTLFHTITVNIGSTEPPQIFRDERMTRCLGTLPLEGKPLIY
jgi:hypothetical protein